MTKPIKAPHQSGVIMQMNLIQWKHVAPNKPSALTEIYTTHSPGTVNLSGRPDVENQADQEQPRFYPAWDRDGFFWGLFSAEILHEDWEKQDH